MDDAPFELTSARIGEVVVLTIVGEVDMATAPDVERALESGHDGASRVVIDLSEVTFLDSSGLNVLVHSQRDLAERNIELRIVCPSDRLVHSVFDITHLTGPLNVVESLDEALTA